MAAVSAPDAAAGIAAHFSQRGHDCWQVGQVTEGVGEVLFHGDLVP